MVHAAPTLPHSQTPALHTFAFVPHATPPQRHDPETHVNPVVQVTLAQASGKHIGSKLISPALLSHERFNSYSLIISKTNIIPAAAAAAVVVATVVVVVVGSISK